MMLQRNWWFVFIFALLVVSATGWISQPLPLGSRAQVSSVLKGERRPPPRVGAEPSVKHTEWGTMYRRGRVLRDTAMMSAAPIEANVEAGKVMAQDEKKPMNKFGSSPEERRRHSAPTARAVGIKVVLVGKPCSGKGTQAPMMARRYRCVHISVGNLLRAEVRIGSDLGKIAKEYMARGELLPDDLVILIVQKRLDQDDCKANGWILDGFPRTLAQAQAMQQYGIEPNAVIVLERPDEMVKDWCIGRSFDPTTGIIYHPKYNPAPPEMEKWLQVREDDQLEVVQKRLDQYHDSYEALMACYKDKVTIINTTKHELEAFKDVCKVLDHFCPADVMDVEEIRLDHLRRTVMLTEFEDDDTQGRSLTTQPALSSMRDSHRLSLLDIISYCNAHEINGFLPVFCGGEQIGYVGHSLAAELFLDKGSGVEFRCALDACAMTGEFVKGYLDLAPGCNTCEERTEVVQGIVDRLVSNGIITLDMWGAHELVDVWALKRPKFSRSPVLRMSRGAFVFFGIPLYGVHVNGLVTGDDGKEYMWIAKRSQSKILYPGLLDQMVSHHQDSRRQGDSVWVGNQTFLYNTISAAQREAAVKPKLIQKIKSAGMVSYRYETAKGLATKILNVYDMAVPKDWRPYNGNGEIDQFTLMGIEEALHHMKMYPHHWKPNAMIVVIDLAVRKGIITPDDADYLEICHGLRVRDNYYTSPTFCKDG